MMRVLLTGACGFVGSTLAGVWARQERPPTIYGIDNFVRAGSELNRRSLRALGVTLFHGDIRSAADFEALPAVDWVVDAAAHPSVLAGVDGKISSRQLVEHNLVGTLNILEYCRRVGAGLILLSTSRVYSIASLRAIPMSVVDHGYRPDVPTLLPAVTVDGITEAFPTAAPLSLYGATKFASETLALEYGDAFDFPVCVNRCGVLAGPGQFGRADQGIFSFWIHSWAARRNLSYIGFGGKGYQVRDCLDASDLALLVARQMSSPLPGAGRIFNVSGGAVSACSLAQLSAWCRGRFGDHDVSGSAVERPFDIPWLVLDSRAAMAEWSWSPVTERNELFEKIALHAEEHPEWLDLTHG